MNLYLKPIPGNNPIYCTNVSSSNDLPKASKYLEEQLFINKAVVDILKAKYNLEMPKYIQDYHTNMTIKEEEEKEEEEEEEEKPMKKKRKFENIRRRKNSSSSSNSSSNTGSTSNDDDDNNDNNNDDNNSKYKKDIEKALKSI